MYSSCNFGRTLSVGAICFEDRFCASKKGGIGGGGQVSVWSAVHMALSKLFTSMRSCLNPVLSSIRARNALTLTITNGDVTTWSWVNLVNPLWHGLSCTWQLLWLAVEKPWSALAWPFLSFLTQMGVDKAPLPL